jgi:hypothetical protein
LEEEYAMQIARDWNVKVSGAGYVTRFAVERAYLSAFDVHAAGGSQYTEYWIPADELDAFNDHIRGSIQVIAEFHAAKETARDG